MKQAIALILLFYSFTSSAQNWKKFKYESGDLLFQEYDCGEICDALRKVGSPLNGKLYTHVGLAYVVGDSVYVIEAIDKDVHITPLYRFMARSVDERGRSKVTVARVTATYQNLAGRAVGFALEKRGIPYDHDYTYDNGKYFSSELIFDAYKTAHNGKALFDSESMSFRDPATGKLNSIWENYYREIGVGIPEGKSAPSPVQIASDENVEVVESFY